MEKLTILERYIAGDILKRAADCLEYDQEAGEYVDNGGFILTLTKEEKAALTRAINKL